MARGASYELQVILKLNDRLSGRLNKSISALGRFGKQARTSLNDYEAFRKGVAKPLSVANLTKFNSKLKAISKDTRTAARDATKFNTNVSKPINTAGLDEAIRKARTLQRAMRGTQGRGSTARPAGVEADNVIPIDRGRRRRRGGGVPDGFERGDNAFDAVRQTKYAWRERFDTLASYTDETRKLYRAQAQLRLVGLPEDDNQKLFAAARQTTKDVPGLTLADSTQNALDLLGALGEVNQTIRSLPLAAKYKVGFESIFDDQFSPAQINEQIRSSFKLLELLGRTQRGEGEMAKMLDVFTQITASTGGRVTPDDLLNMARRGNPAVQSLSERGLRNVATLIEDMGAQQVGTALQTLFQGVVGGQMRQASIERFDYYGLIDRSKVKFGKAQQIKRLKPGANLLSPLLLDDPMKAADLLRERMASKGVDVKDESAVLDELMVLFQNRNAQRLMYSFMNQTPQIEKERKRGEQSKGVLQMYGQMKDDPLLKLKEAEAAWKNFQAELGGPLLKTAADVSRALLPVASFFGEHPKVTEYGAKLFLVSKGLGAIVETGALLNRVGLTDFFGRSQASASLAGVEIDRVEGKVNRLNKGIRGLPSAIAVGVAFAGIPVALEGLLKLLNERGEIEVKIKEAGEAAAAKYNEDLRAGKLYKGERAPEQEGRDILNRLNTENKLTLALIRDDKGFPTPGRSNDIFEPRPFGKWYNPADSFNTKSASSQLENLAPELHDWRRMATVIEQVRAGGLTTKNAAGETLKVSDEGIKKFLQALEGFDSTAYQLATAELKGTGEASKLLLQNFLDLSSPTQQTAQNFKDLAPPAGKLPFSFHQVGYSADNLASRLLGLKIEIPSFDRIEVPSVTSTAGGQTNVFTGRQPFTFGGPVKAGPLKATGGTVQREGFAYVHRAEDIVPAKVTRQWRNPSPAPRPRPDAAAAFNGLALDADGRNDTRRERLAEAMSGRARPADAADFSDAAVSIHAPVSIHISDAKDADAVAGRVRDELARHRAELERLIAEKTNPRRTHRMIKRRRELEEEGA